MAFHMLRDKIPTNLNGIGQLRIDPLPLEKETVAFTLPSELGYEHIAMGGLAAFARKFGFPPSRIADLKTAVAEAYINAVQHGNEGRPDARVVIVFNFKDGILGISVFDEGDGFKENPRDPDIERIIENLDPPAGFGVFLMKRLTDKFEYRKSGDHLNEIRMSMKLGIPD
jgi:serine/threonine-protein kinase RsbW